MTRNRAGQITRPVVRAAIYCRMSLARWGDTVGVEDQKKLCLEVAKQRGWQVASLHIYVDNSKSAWQRNRKRPGWDAMLAAIGAGEIDAIVVYHGDRLIRQPWDLELLLRIADERHMPLASPTGDRNLDSPDDRFVLRIEAASACRESDNTSRRTKRYYQRRAEAGYVRLGGRGGRAFGFEPDGLTVREADAEMIREAARRVLAGEKVGAVCRDLNRRGYVTSAGNPWDHGALKKLLLRPRLAGLVSHHGQVIGTAAWPAILDRDTWESVCAVLQHKATAFAYTSNARRYLLSGIARCGTCDQPVVIRHNARGVTLLGYGCVNKACPKKVHRAAHHVDAYVEGAALQLLNDKQLRERMRPAGSGKLIAELAAAEEKRARILRDFGEADGDDPDAADVLRVSLRANREKIEKLKAEIASQQTGHILDDLWGIDLPRWRSLGLDRQRAAVNALMVVRILPSGRRGPGFDPATVVLEKPPGVR